MIDTVDLDVCVYDKIEIIYGSFFRYIYKYIAREVDIGVNGRVDIFVFFVGHLTI